MNVELRHLRVLAAIGDEGGISAAADVLRVSQPAVSRTLSQLEHRVGRELVRRTTRSLELTEAGRRLWEHSHTILTRVDSALAEATGEPRALRVGFAWAVLGSHTVPLLRSWHDSHPGTPVQVRRTDDPEAALRTADVDVAVLRTHAADATLASVPLYRERRVAAVAESDQLSERPALRLADLARRSVALCATAATTRAELWPRHRHPRTFEVTGVDEWLTTIATGDAVGVTSEGTGYSHPYPGIRYLPVDDAPAVTVRIASPHNPTHPATGAFVRHVRATVRTW